MKNCAKIVMAKRNQAIVEANSRRAAEAAAAAKEWETAGTQVPAGSGDGRGGCTKATDPFEVDEDDDWGSETETSSEPKQYAWLLDRSFTGPNEGERDWEEEDWGDVPMDTTENPTPGVKSPNEKVAADGCGEDWKDAAVIPDEWDWDSAEVLTPTAVAGNAIPDEWDSEGVVTRDVEKEDAKDNTSMSTLTACSSSSVPFVLTTKEEEESESRSFYTPKDAEREIATNHSSTVTNTNSQSILSPSPPPSDLSVSADFGGKEARIHIHLGGHGEGPKEGSNSSSGISSTTGTETSSYNTFQYWRFPIPDLELDIDMKNGKATNVHVRAMVHDPCGHVTYSSELNVNIRMETQSTDRSESLENPAGGSSHSESEAIPIPTGGYKLIPRQGDFTLTVNGGKEVQSAADGDEQSKNGSSALMEGSTEAGGGESGENPVTVLLESNEGQSLESSNTGGFIQGNLRVF